MYFSFLGPTSSTKQYVMNRITLNAFLLPTCKISQLGKWPWSACQPLRCQFCAWRACSQVSDNKYNGRKYFVLKYVQLFKKQLLLILNHKGDMNPGLQKETPVYDLSNHPNQLLTQTVLVLLTSTLEVQEVMLEGSLQLTRLLYWKHWARLLKKKELRIDMVNLPPLLLVIMHALDGQFQRWKQSRVKVTKQERVFVFIIYSDYDCVMTETQKMN